MSFKPSTTARTPVTNSKNNKSATDILKQYQSQNTTIDSWNIFRTQNLKPVPSSDASSTVGRFNTTNYRINMSQFVNQPNISHKIPKKGQKSNPSLVRDTEARITIQSNFISNIQKQPI